MSAVFTADYVNEVALGTAESLEQDYSSVTDNGTSGDSANVAKALDGKNNEAWYPSVFPTSLEVTFDDPVKVNAAEVALDWFWPGYYGIDDLDIEYWNGTEGLQ